MFLPDIREFYLKIFGLQRHGWLSRDFDLMQSFHLMIKRREANGAVWVADNTSERSFSTNSCRNLVLLIPGNFLVSSSG